VFAATVQLRHQRLAPQPGLVWCVPSACLDRCAEDVRIQALVIAKLELVDVEREILFADLVEGADDPAFHDGPEPFDSVGMNCTADILPLGVMHHPMRESRIEPASRYDRPSKAS
jgi:hypothetical protein